MSILGLDIGGANIKASDAVWRAISRPFAIWRQPELLKDQISSILSEYPLTDTVAVTMTAELADCFSTKAEGVRFVLDAVEQGICEWEARERSASADHRAQLRPVSMIVWSTDGEFVQSVTAKENHLKVAAGNWHALSTWSGPLVPVGTGLIVDIGTTTTDLVPMRDGKPVPQGLTDVSRMQCGELSYSGIRRTPLCAIANSVPFRDGYSPLAAEVFATTLDVHLLLEHIADDEHDLETANGKPATRAAAHDRMARMLCCDRDEMSLSEAVQIAKFLCDVQRQRLAGSLERVLRRIGSPCETVILSGSGTFLARRLIEENRTTSGATVISLADRLSPTVAESACAFAVAQLAANG